MLKNLFNRIISRIYDILEAERTRRAERLLAELRAKKEERTRKNAQALLADLHARQAKCKHLKGLGGPTTHLDYNVHQHTFPDNRITIKCGICGKEWSTENGNLEVGRSLAKKSSNTPTSSEVSLYEPVNRFEPEQVIESEEMAKMHDKIMGGDFSPWLGHSWTMKTWDRLLAKFSGKKLPRKKKHV